jgi:integrase
MTTKRLTDADVKSARANTGERREIWDKVTAGLCLRVTTGRRVWIVRYRAAGKQRRFVIGEYPGLDLADARITAAQVLRDARKIKADPAGKKAEAKARPIKTLADLAEAYMVACQEGKWRPRNKVQSARTLKDARESLDFYILPALGKLELAEVNRRTVKTFIRALAERGIGAQCNKAVSLIRRMYNWAIIEFEGDIVSINVANGQERQVETPRDRVLSDQELKLFWRTMTQPAGLRLYSGPDDAEGKPVYLSRSMAILLQLATLLLQRRAELAGMRTSEVNLDRAQWLIPAVRMKARRSHLVPLPDEAVKLIREALVIAKAMQPPPAEGEVAPTDYPLFPSPRDPRQSIKASSVTQIMKLVTGAIGLDNVSPHDLRRSGSTAMTSERLGVSRFVRSLVLSHHTEQDGGAAVSAKHYDANDYIKEKRAALQSWECLLMEIVGERERTTNVKRLKR